MTDSPTHTPRLLETVDAVLDELGGNVLVAIVTGKGERAVSNWRSRGRIAADEFLVMTTALLERGCAGRPELWGIKTPPTAS